MEVNELMQQTRDTTIRDVTFGLLRELGITTVFGNPGSTEETFLKDFPDDFRYVLTLQEASAVGAADGYAQAMRHPALVNVHTSAGLSNSMGNLMSASMNRTPLIVTAGNQTREMLLLDPWLANIEPETLPRPWVKWSYQPVRAADVPAAFMRAYAAAVQPPAGPVFLSIPLDDWDQPASSVAVVRTLTSRIGPDPDRIAEFADALSSATNPVLVRGSSIARGEGWDQAVALAEKLNAPVWAAPVWSGHRSLRITRCTPVACRSRSDPCARSSRATTSPSSSAPPCSGTTPTLRARSSPTGCGCCTSPMTRWRRRVLRWVTASCPTPYSPSRN